GDRVVAIVDTDKGHADVFPSLEKLTPMANSDGKNFPPIPKNHGDAAERAAGDLLSQGLFPPDATKPVLDKMLTLNAAQFNKGSTGPANIGPLFAVFIVAGPVLHFECCSVQ